MMEHQNKPGIAGYIVAAAFLVAGGCGFAASLWMGLHHLTDNLIQIVVPGSADLRLMRSGRYSVYLETQSVVGGKVYATTESVEGLRCHVKEKESGRELALYRPGLSTSYTVGGRSGRSVLTFMIEQPGMYTFSCNYEENQAGPETVLAVGSGVQGRLLRTLGLSFLSIFVGLIIGLTFFLLTYQKRLKFKRSSARGYPITS